MNKTIVITGASDGIGAAAAKQLVELGHRVVIVGRNAVKTERIANQLGMPFHIADFTRLSDVRRLADELRGYSRIDVLVNNAGAIFNGRTVTADGFERTFQVNVLSGFFLTQLLSEKLCSSNATVIFTSSIASNLFGCSLDISDLQNKRKYTPSKAYGESKLCNILLARELHKRYHSYGINSVAFEPGIPRSNFASEGSRFFRMAYHSPLKYLFTISVDRSAKRIVRLALGTPGRDFQSGGMYSNKKRYNVRFKDDGSISQKLWNECTRMTERFSE